MASYSSHNLRNIAFAGHGQTGKTTLCESLLSTSGKTDKPGSVGNGTSVFDFEPEEQKRRVSLNVAVNFCEWNKHRINLIDTPGDVNFSFEMKYGLRVADAAVVLVDAISGVEFQTENVWMFAEELSLPRIIFVNKMDRERADFIKALESITTTFGRKASPCYLPIGAQDALRGVIDLIGMKALLYDDAKEKFKREDIPADLMDEAIKFREILLEDIAERDEILMEKYLEQGDLSEEEIKNGLRKGILSGDIIPATCGSALNGIGVAALLDMIVEYLPSPVDRGAAKGKKPGSDEVMERTPDEATPFSSIVFKTITDPYAGKLTLFRVYSGTLTTDSPFYNASRKITERLGNIFYLEGKNQKPAEKLIPGDIGAVAKLKETATGDTLCNEKAPIILDIVKLPHAVVSYAVEPKSKGDEEKIISSLNKLRDEDPTLQLYRNDETRETIIAGVGQVHLDVTIEKLKRKFGVEMNLRHPKVPYKETIKGKTTIQGKYKKQSGGRGQYGDTWLDIEPLPRGEGFKFEDKIVGGVIPKSYIPAVEKGIVEAMEEGIIAGYPVVDVKVSLIDGSYHAVDSSEMAFKIAGSMGFKKGFQQCQPTLLEPIVIINIEIPDEYMGDVIGDLNSRRGRILGMDKIGRNQVIRGQVALAEILDYAPIITSITSGRGTFSYEISHYEEVPSHLQEKIISESKKKE